MQEQILHIKNMVCPRCIIAVEDALRQESIDYIDVELGEIKLKENISSNQTNQLKNRLQHLGFELIEANKEKLVNQIKVSILAYLRNDYIEFNENLSQYLTDQLHTDYSHLSKTFSEIHKSTIEQYFIQQKIEYAKELLSYRELSLTEIADKLNYSSVAYLSKQFKEITHLTPTQYLKSADKNRIALYKI